MCNIKDLLEKINNFISKNYYISVKISIFSVNTTGLSLKITSGKKIKHLSVKINNFISKNFYISVKISIL